MDAFLDGIRQDVKPQLFNANISFAQVPQMSCILSHALTDLSVVYLLAA